MSVTLLDKTIPTGAINGFVPVILGGGGTGVGVDTAIRAGTVELTVPSTTVIFSTPLASALYTLELMDVDGVGISLTSQSNAGFVVESLGVGTLNYHAILNT